MSEAHLLCKRLEYQMHVHPSSHGISFCLK